MSKKPIQSKNTVEGRNGGTLIPFKKGDPSPNPNGRPKGSLNRSTIVRKWLDAQEKVKNPITGLEETLTQSDIMTLGLIKEARKGNVQAYKELMDSGFGKIKDELDMTSGGERLEPQIIVLPDNGRQ